MNLHILKPLLSTFLLILCVISKVDFPCANAETLRFAPLPMENRETVVKQFRPMTEYLEQRLGEKIVFSYSDSYQDIIDKFCRSEVDIAYLGPLPYVRLRFASSHAEPLVQFKEKSGKAFYTCSIVSIPDADFDLKSATERKIGLTQPLSTCGYLSTSGLMLKSGSDIEQNYYRYIGKHDEVALSIVRGEFDAGGLKTAIARKYRHLGLKIVAETSPLPGFALVGNSSTLSVAQMEKIRQVFIALDPEGGDKALLSKWGDNIRYGAVVADDANYKVVRDLLGNAKIPETGNYVNEAAFQSHYR